MLCRVVDPSETWTSSTRLYKDFNSINFGVTTIVSSFVPNLWKYDFKPVDHDGAHAGHPLQGLHPVNHVWI